MLSVLHVQGNSLQADTHIPPSSSCMHTLPITEIILAGSTQLLYQSLNILGYQCRFEVENTSLYVFSDLQVLEKLLHSQQILCDANFGQVTNLYTDS